MGHPNVTPHNETRMVQTPENVGLLDQNQPSTQGVLLKFEFESNGGARVQVALLGKWTRMVDIKKIRPTNQHHPRRAQMVKNERTCTNPGIVYWDILPGII